MKNGNGLENGMIDLGVSLLNVHILVMQSGDELIVIHIIQSDVIQYVDL